MAGCNTRAGAQCACPLCRLRGRIGRLVAANDDAGQHFVFAVCHACDVRLNRLPAGLQRKQLNLAIRNLARDESRYKVWHFGPSADAARIFCHMEASVLSSPRPEKNDSA